MSKGKIIVESQFWKIEKVYIDWDIEHWSITNKETSEYMIINKEQFEELLSFNNITEVI